mgnify:CR=1 FL=1
MNRKESFYEYMYNYEYEEYYEFDEEIVNPIVEIIRRYDNFQKKEEKKLTYSHNNYFKAPTCRVDLNNVCGFVEDDNLLQNLVAMRFDLGKI